MNTHFDADVSYPVLQDFLYQVFVNNKYQIKDGDSTMMAVVTMGNGGYEMLNYSEVPRPVIGPGEVLIKVLAAGVNNTEINTRLGWYSSSVTSSTESFADDQESDSEEKSDGGWDKVTPFPFIQGTDCCGIVEKVFADDESALIGKRCLVRACMRTDGFDSLETVWMASDFDGAFAQYVKVPVSEVFPVECNWSDAELATIPCAYATSENMLHRARVGVGDRVLITGASGGVGSATVQLAKRRGAFVIAVCGEDKMEKVKEIGADQVVSRKQNLLELLGERSVDVVVDNVAGQGFPDMLKLLKKGGHYASSGAIAGPIVELDMRDFYLKDINMIGCTAWDEAVFPNLVRYIELEEIKPLLARTFPLDSIAEAQKEFLEKKHVGNFVLIPPQV